MKCRNCDKKKDVNKFDKFWRNEKCDCCGYIFRKGMIDRLVYPVVMLIVAIFVTFFWLFTFIRTSPSTAGKIWWKMGSAG
tara:strand:- start:34 stop:273 length:240 start_codon:yes stop_codon:yes gene_type:complete